MAQKTDRFYRWWVSHKGRPPLPEENEEFEAARSMWEDLWGAAGIDPEIPAVIEDDPKTYADGFRDCAAQILALFPPVVSAVWEEWAEGQMPWWSLERSMLPQPVDANEQTTVSFRALRSESEFEYLVALMRPGSKIACLDDVEHVVCEVKTDRLSEGQMRRDYRAAEAFAALLTSLPHMISLRQHLERVLGMRMPEPAAALTEETDDGQDT
jgi:hypothetical protein